MSDSRFEAKALYFVLAVPHKTVAFPRGNDGDARVVSYFVFLLEAFEKFTEKMIALVDDSLTTVVFWEDDNKHILTST
jgi:KaiC/GvpD/RAD55 family RecA-like ATPase